jgi:hypothetical protein
MKASIDDPTPPAMFKKEMKLGIKLETRVIRTITITLSE